MIATVRVLSSARRTVDRRAIDLDLRLGKLGEIALHGAHADADQLGELFKRPALGEPAQGVQNP